MPRRGALELLERSGSEWKRNSISRFDEGRATAHGACLLHGFSFQRAMETSSALAEALVTVA